MRKEGGDEEEVKMKKEEQVDDDKEEEEEVGGDKDDDADDDEDEGVEVGDPPFQFTTCDQISERQRCYNQNKLEKCTYYQDTQRDKKNSQSQFTSHFHSLIHRAIFRK